MSGMEPKKLSLIRIMQILERETDADHPLTHAEIVERLRADYGIEIERKVVGRTISMLNEAGYDIVTTKRGCYVAARVFDDSELHLLIDGVMSSKHISAKHSKDLIERLCGLSNKYFPRRVKHIHTLGDWNKTEHTTVFYNIEVIDAAIDAERQLFFDYNKYGADKKMHRTAHHRVSPYLMILHNQRYYLMGYNEKWQHMQYYRMDRITEIKLTEEPITRLRSIPGYENGINYKQLTSALPYMYSDAPVTVDFYAEGSIIDQVIDWFGRDITITPKDERYLVRVTVSPNAMEHWAMQYGGAVEVISPASLRENIIGKLQWTTERYQNKGDNK